MKIRVIEGLPFVEVTVHYRGKSLTLNNVLIDTGSAGTIFHVDHLYEIGIQPEPEDTVHTIRGVGGVEFVYTKTLDTIEIGDSFKRNFEIEMGAMEYGFEMDGIVGFDLLQELGMIIDTKGLEIGKSK